MEIIQSKSLLAKLMATENLVVEQRKVNTASFDVVKRVLTVPILDKNISGYLYDLFMGHEVGHALETPAEGMKKAWEMKIPMSIMNVLEDVRIERKIKNKYPGLRLSFVKGYRELIEKDFFGTKDIDLNDLNFLDRINLYTKGGAAQGIKFNEEEKVLLEKIESTETYDDVIDLAKEIMDYMKKEKEEKKKNTSNDPDEDYDEIDDGDDDWSPQDSDTDMFDDLDEMDETEDDSNHPDEAKESKQKDQEKSQNDDYVSHTDEAYRKNETKLFASDPVNYYYGNIPDMDLDKLIINHKTIWKKYRLWVEGQELDHKGIDTKEFLKIRNDAKKVVGYLAKEFELRKNAEQLKRASESKTGELNMNKIYSYKFAEDIFKKMTIVPDGKSHGLIMFLDWSGSMHDHMGNTIKQLINLVMFCKKVNIPFEVYAFSSDYDDVYRPNEVVGDLQVCPFNLMNLFSSKMSASEFTYAGSALVRMFISHGGYRPFWLNLGGTPLTEAIIAALKVVPAFQKQYKLQIVNTVFLTDGDGHSVSQVYVKHPNNPSRLMAVWGDEYSEVTSNYRSTKKLVIVDPVTKQQEFCTHDTGRPLTSHYIKMLKARTGCNVVGFYIMSGREFGRESRHFFPNVFDVSRLKQTFRKEKCMVVTSAGYDEYYLLRAEGLDTEDEVTFEVKENATTRGLVSAFSKYTEGRLANRTVLNRFIGMIA